MAFRAIHSNRVEVLASQLLTRLSADPLVDPFAPEYVLVDNTVLGSWLNLQLALNNGIAANIRYLQPHQLFWQLARAMQPSLPQDTPLSKAEMTWKLHALLGDENLLATPVMQPVRHYLQDEACRTLKRYQLAAVVADLFDQYLIYRPTMMLAWESPEQMPKQMALMSEGFSWQRALWEALTSLTLEQHQPGLHHRAAIENSLLAALDADATGALCQAVPMQRLSVFGMTSMPPRLLDMLMLLGRQIPVDLYVLNPCRGYWFDIRPARSLVKKAGKREVGAGVIGNPLLASQGQQVREFIELLYARLDQFPFDEVDCFKEPGAGSLLQCIQQEILDLQYQGGMAELACVPSTENRQPMPAVELGNAIRSVQIHSCHSPLREVEVLYDQLLALFAQDTSLQPRDVVVMMPQVAPYVPYINAVFGATTHALPYHINDRSWLEEVPLLNVLDVLLGLPSSRLPLTDILAMLEVPAVQATFGLDREGFEKLKVWLRDAGARWGLDAAHREHEGLPAYSEFSWEFAINRMMAGYAVACDVCENVRDEATLGGATLDEPLWLGGGCLPVMPYAEVEGGATALLDSFLQFWTAVRTYRDVLTEPATPAVWADRMAALLDAFFVPQTTDEQLALREIRKEVGLLRKASQWSDVLIDISVVRAVLQPAIQASVQGGHAWREGVKFCSLMPMRGVPFRVVYLLGMNQSDYPKRSTQHGFDVMRRDHQPGDRSRRVDDRWLFLEALLSARDVFHVSYIGRDQRKNEPRQPSVVLAELMDYVRHGYSVPGVEDPEGKAVLQSLMVEHPLQPFSRDYFAQDHAAGLLSFNKQAFAIATGKQQVEVHSIDDAIWLSSGKTDESVEVSLDSLVQFFTNPPKWFFRDRCKKVNLSLNADAISDNEVLGLPGSLEEWQLKDALREIANRLDVDEVYEQRVETVFDRLETRWKAEARWPLGAGGKKLRDRITKELVKTTWLDARRHLAGDPMTHSGVHSFNTARGTLVVRGELSSVGDALFIHTASKSAKKRDLLLAIQCAFAGLTMPSVSRAIAVFWDKTKVVSALNQNNHQAFLQTLAELYMQYREHGLPFEPGLSLSFTPEHEQNRQKWNSAVNQTWFGNGFTSEGVAGDIQNLAYYLSIQRLLQDVVLTVASQVTTALHKWEQGNQEAQEKQEKQQEVQP